MAKFNGIGRRIAAALLVLNMIWKIRLMKQEKGLIEAGKAVSA